MKILFIGRKGEKSYHHFLSLKKIYRNVDFIDPNKAYIFPSIGGRISNRFSPKIFEPIVNIYVLSKIKKHYDLIFVRSIELISEKLILLLKKKTKKIVCYCADNPFANRDRQVWKLALPALKYYDLVVFQQPSRIKLSKKYGIKKSLLVLPPYQKKIHCPQKLTMNEKKKYSNDVIFIGTWMPERGIFFNKLIDMGLNLKIFGTRWKKDKNYKLLKSRITLGHVGDSLYPKLIQCSKIALCIPSEQNLDDITERSIEIPAIGTLLCATRTRSHQKMLIENKEAIFF